MAVGTPAVAAAAGPIAAGKATLLEREIRSPGEGSSPHRGFPIRSNTGTGVDAIQSALDESTPSAMG